MRAEKRRAVSCEECGGPVEVWADNSDGVTVNFACDNPACKSGKPPWDTPRQEVKA